MQRSLFSLIPMPDITTAVIHWQKKYGRHHLPWQQDNDPYKIWLSEVMLQQTQVTTVIPYYHRFLHRFPTVNVLARARTDSVLAAWSGLGYYARARHLHQTAKQMHQHGMPNTIEQWQALPGIGRSSAAAIMVFAHGQCHAILDGNVKRILARLLMLEHSLSSTAATEALWAKAHSLLPSKRHIRAYTQGLMDLGSLLCLRQRPLCHQCPLSPHCLAHQQQVTEHYPQRASKRHKPKKQAILIWLRWNQCTLLQKRPDKGIWGGLWSLPETTTVRRLKSIWETDLQCRLSRQKIRQFTHEFTHYQLQATVYIYDCCTSPETPTGKRWIPHNKLTQIGLPTPIRSLLDPVNPNE